MVIFIRSCELASNFFLKLIPFVQKSFLCRMQNVFIINFPFPCRSVPPNTSIFVQIFSGHTKRHLFAWLERKNCLNLLNLFSIFCQKEGLKSKGKVAGCRIFYTISCTYFVVMQLFFLIPYWTRQGRKTETRWPKKYKPGDHLYS